LLVLGRRITSQNAWSYRPPSQMVVPGGIFRFMTHCIDSVQWDGRFTRNKYEPTTVVNSKILKIE
jgi:hypothetical protein